MVYWLPLAGLIAVALGGYHVLIKLSAAHIHQALGAVVLQLVAALLGGGVVAVLTARGASLPVTAKGMWLAAAAGLLVGLAELLTFVHFSRGVPASRGIPVLVGGSILVAALLGVALLRESLSGTQCLGAAFIVAGVAMLSR